MKEKTLQFFRSYTNSSIRFVHIRGFNFNLIIDRDALFKICRAFVAPPVEEIKIEEEDASITRWRWNDWKYRGQLRNYFWGARGRDKWQNTPAQCSTRFGIRQDGRMGPSVVISVVRRSQSHLKKKQQYETLQLQEYRLDTLYHHRHQMVSENIF